VFARDAFPRRSGTSIQIGAPIPNTLGCAQACDLTFPQFRGTSLAVADLDGDGRLDVTVVSPRTVQRRDGAGGTVSDTPALQIGLRRADARFYAEFTDLADSIAPLGGEFRADRVTNGRTDDLGGRLVAIVSAAIDQGAARSLRLLRPVAATGGSGAPLAFEDWTDRLPVSGPDDHLEAAALAFEDLDGNGLDDLVLLAGSAPTAGRSGLRILRAFPRVTGTLAFVASYVDALDALVDPSEDLSGDALTLGDLAGDGLPSFVLSRAAPSGEASDTRVIRMRTR
jgi:hypothetical protein